MPKLNGYETTKRLEATSKDSPIFGVNADISEKNKGKCKNEEMNCFLEKPINRGRLLELLERSNL